MTEDTNNQPFRAETLGFEVGPESLEERAEWSRGALERLIAEPRHPFQRLFDITSACVTIGKPSVASLPPRVGQPAESLGFSPVARVFAGTFPALFHHVPIFADPTGVAVMSVYGFGNRWYLHTYFDDGTAISTGLRSSGNARTAAYTALELESGYIKHMKLVKEAMETREVRPIVRNTADLLRLGWRVYRLNYVSPLQGLVLTLSGWFIIFGAGFLVWTIVSRFLW
jgi:hypothetical protein